MSTPPLDTANAAQLVASALVIDGANRTTRRPRWGRRQPEPRLRPRPRRQRRRHGAGLPGTPSWVPDESALVAAFLAIALSDLAARVLGREGAWGVDGTGSHRSPRSSRPIAIRPSWPPSPRVPGIDTSATTSRWSPTPSTASRSNRSVPTPSTCTATTPTSPSRSSGTGRPRGLRSLGARGVRRLRDGR
jgi:hypothetical protein